MPYLFTSTVATGGLTSFRPMLFDIATYRRAAPSIRDAGHMPTPTRHTSVAEADATKKRMRIRAMMIRIISGDDAHYYREATGYYDFDARHSLCREAEPTRSHLMKHAAGATAHVYACQLHELFSPLPPSGYRRRAAFATHYFARLLPEILMPRRLRTRWRPLDAGHSLP